MNFKKKIFGLFIACVMIFSASSLAFATTPEPAANTQSTPQVQQSVPVTTTQQNVELENSKYLTKGGAAFWFIFTIVINLAASFWVGNRFYRMSKKDSHITAEIRALRKDIDEKFSSSVGGFAEQEINIKNLNESFAMDDEGIKPVEKKPVLREISEEEEERFRRWEEAQSRTRSERTRVSRPTRIREDKEEINEENEVRRIRRKNYQPKRTETDLFDSGDEDETEDLGSTKEIKLSRNDGVKSKAKEILGDIFPFKED